MSKKSISFIKQGFLILLGNLMYALALNLFLVQNDIAAGGFAGIATMINHYVSVPVGTTVFLMNIPLIIWAWKSYGRAFAVRCIIGNIVFTLVTDCTAFLPLVTDYKLTAAILGGICYGIGVSIMVKVGAAAGGTDLLSRLLILLFKKMTVGKMIFLLDGTVVLLSAFVYGTYKNAMYAAISIAVYSLTADYILRIFKNAEHRRKDPLVLDKGKEDLHESY